MHWSSTPSLLHFWRRYPLAKFFAALTWICIPAVLPLTAQRTPQTTRPASSAIRVSGIPNRPDLVTVVPFYTKPNETELEKTRVVFEADVGGHHGLLLLDLGDPDLDLNRTFLRPRAQGGLDTVRTTDTTDEHRLPEWSGLDSAHVTLRIGTFPIDFVDPTKPADARRINALLNHQFGNYAQVFPPRLGNIGPIALESFETIIDYPHRRLVLIRLDSAGHRRVAVPAYTPAWSAPLIDIPIGGGKHWWGLEASLAGTLDTVFFDTGSEGNYLTAATTAQAAAHIVHDTLDSLTVAGRALGPVALRTDATPPLDVLGFPFLAHFGVVGFNHRTHQFILYRTSSIASTVSTVRLSSARFSRHGGPSHTALVKNGVLVDFQTTREQAPWLAPY